MGSKIKTTYFLQNVLKLIIQLYSLLDNNSSGSAEDDDYRPVNVKKLLGKGKIIKILRGSKARDVNKYSSFVSVYGQLKDFKEEFVVSVVDSLVDEEFLELKQSKVETDGKTFSVSVVNVADKAIHFVDVQEDSLAQMIGRSATAHEAREQWFGTKEAPDCVVNNGRIEWPSDLGVSSSPGGGSTKRTKLPSRVDSIFKAKYGF
eukprot:TRINITY_DN8214_c0_g1_i1.p1 TRINITY_DN8214_c0_g1~~TRINITY_DN8214_c0_g1_i1.p1  ORF type:complete len:204 (-),score=54.73 TRINITY_DN8214_c0_g1_i1:42-653(-)